MTARRRRRRAGAAGAAGLTHVFDDTGSTNFGTTCTATITGALQAGDLILFLVGVSGVTVTITGPGSFTPLYDVAGVASTERAAAYYKISDGTETSVAFTTSGNARLSGIVRVFRGTSNPPTAATPATGTSATPNPPSHTPAGGSKEYYWIATAHTVNSSNSYTGDPANYDTAVEAAAGSISSGHKSRSMLRLLTASTEDPGSYSYSTSRNWVGSTITVD